MAHNTIYDSRMEQINRTMNATVIQYNENIYKNIVMTCLQIIESKIYNEKRKNEEKDKTKIEKQKDTNQRIKKLQDEMLQLLEKEGIIKIDKYMVWEYTKNFTTPQIYNIFNQFAFTTSKNIKKDMYSHISLTDYILTNLEKIVTRMFVKYDFPIELTKATSDMIDWGTVLKICDEDKIGKYLDIIPKYAFGQIEEIPTMINYENIMKWIEDNKKYIPWEEYLKVKKVDNKNITCRMKEHIDWENIDPTEIDVAYICENIDKINWEIMARGIEITPMSLLEKIENVTNAQQGIVKAFVWEDILEKYIIFENAFESLKKQKMTQRFVDNFTRKFQNFMKETGIRKKENLPNDIIMMINMIMSVFPIGTKSAAYAYQYYDKIPGIDSVILNNKFFLEDVNKENIKELVNVMPTETINAILKIKNIELEHQEQLILNVNIDI